MTILYWANVDPEQPDLTHLAYLEGAGKTLCGEEVTAPSSPARVVQDICPPCYQIVHNMPDVAVQWKPRRA